MACGLIFLNSFRIVLAAGLVATSLWFFVEVTNITSLRNRNHYLLDYNVYWPQGTPWIFIIVGIFSLVMASFGIYLAKKKKFTKIYVILEVVSILFLIGAAIIALVFADSKMSDKFIEDTIWDAFSDMKITKEVNSAYSDIQKRLQCCGAGSPRDYVSWMYSFPPSCCDTYYHGWIGQYVIDCDFTNKLANERHGCAEVVMQYSRIIMKVLSGLTVFMAVMGIIAVLVTSFMRPKRREPNHQVVYESESKKVLL